MNTEENVNPTPTPTPEDWCKLLSIVEPNSHERIPLAETQVAIAKIERVDTEMLSHMNKLQGRFQRNLTTGVPVIVAEFTPGGGRFTFLHRGADGKGSRSTVEPVPKLYALSKSVAHAPLGIFACIAPFCSGEKKPNPDWKGAVEDYNGVLKDALQALKKADNNLPCSGTQPEEEELCKKVSANLASLDTPTEDTNITAVMVDLLQSSIDFVDKELCPKQFARGRDIADVFSKWCKGTTLATRILQCQVIAATVQQYGISTQITAWKEEIGKAWEDLYVIVEAEYVTREENSIAQCIQPIMDDPDNAPNQRLLVVTNLSGVDPALHFLSRILEDRAAADLILGRKDQEGDREHLRGMVDLLGPTMKKVIGCPHA